MLLFLNLLEIMFRKHVSFLFNRNKNGKNEEKGRITVKLTIRWPNNYQYKFCYIN